MTKSEIENRLNGITKEIHELFRGYTNLAIVELPKLKAKLEAFERYLEVEYLFPEGGIPFYQKKKEK